MNKMELFFFFFFYLLTFYQRRSKVNDTKTLKVVYQANQKEKLLYKNSSTFRCNLGFVNNFCKENSNVWVLHAFCNIAWASDNLEHRKKMCSTVSFSLPTESTYRGVTHTVFKTSASESTASTATE